MASAPAAARALDRAEEDELRDAVDPDVAEDHRLATGPGVIRTPPSIFHS
jgi:hypothetical protein